MWMSWALARPSRRLIDACRARARLNGPPRRTLFLRFMSLREQRGGLVAGTCCDFTSLLHLAFAITQRHRE